MTEAARDDLYSASVAFAGVSGDLEKAWTAIGRTRLRRTADRLLGDKTQATDLKLALRKGWPAIEKRLRTDPVLPAGFRANPAQHFYAVQQALRTRRRKQWGEACDRELDAVALAA